MPGAALASGNAIARLMRGHLRSRQYFHVPAEARTGTPRAEHPCFWYCTTCGFMVPPSGEDKPPPCRECEDTQWADLREGGVIEALIVMDDERRDTRDDWGHGAWMLIPALISTAFALFLFVWFLAGLEGITEVESGNAGGALVGLVLAFLPVAFFSFIAAVALRGAIRKLKTGVRIRHATRWRYHDVHISKISARARRGIATGEPSIVAPFSGTPCLAYVVGVRPDEIAMREPWSWSVETEDIGALGIDGQPIASNAMIATAPHVFERPAPGALRAEDVDRALRERGIDPQRPGYDLFETVILPGDAIVVRSNGHQAVISVV